MAEQFRPCGAGEAELLRRYVAALPGKSIQIEDLWQQLKARPADRDTLEDLSLHVHRLSGSAAPYGLPGLSEAARSVDRFIAPLARKGETPPGMTLTALQPLMEDLRHRMFDPF